MIRTPRRGDDRVVRSAQGSRLQLSCAADGYPEPEVKWYKVSSGLGTCQSGESRVIGQVGIQGQARLHRLRLNGMHKVN